MHIEQKTIENIGDFIRKIIVNFEEEGIAYFIPTSEQMNKLDNGLNQDHILRPYWAQFTKIDEDSQHNKPGDSIRAISANPKLIKRALMWLQRQYLHEYFSNYDPTSDRDEDLPVDLDHLVPHDLFGFHWKSKESKLNIKEEEILDAFWKFRYDIGNSLGNYRWLSSSDNRGLGKTGLMSIDCDLIDSPNDWNNLINAQKDKWRKEHIASFQRLIVSRAIKLFKTLVIETGLQEFRYRNSISANKSEETKSQQENAVKTAIKESNK